VLELVPTAVSLLDRLRLQAERVRQLGSQLAANISSLRSQIDIARDQANLVSTAASIALSTVYHCLSTEYCPSDEVLVWFSFWSKVLIVCIWSS